MREFFRGTVTRQDWVNVGIVVTLSAIIGAVFVLFIHTKQISRLADLQNDDKQVVKDLDNARQIKANIQSLRTERDKMEAVVSDFEKRLPLERDIPRLLEQFESIAKEANVEVSLKSLPRQEDPNKERIPFAITARGDFNQIASFINRLERFERYLKISDLKIGKEKDGISEASFTLSTYRFIEKSPPATPSGAGAAQ